MTKIKIIKEYVENGGDTPAQLVSDVRYLLQQLDAAVELLRRVRPRLTPGWRITAERIDAYLAQLGEGKE